MPNSFARIAPRSFAFVLGVIAFGIGLIFCVIGFSGGSEERALRREGRVSQGTVLEKRIEHVTRRKKGGGIEEQRLHLIRYRFTTQGGATPEGEQAVGEALWRSLRQDGPVAIRYLESDPFANRLDAEPGSVIDTFLVVSGLFAAAGVVLIAWGLWTARRTVALLRTGTPCVASVTRVESRTVRRRTTYRIHYTYEAPGGGMQKGKSLALTANEAEGWKAGDTGRIRVDPNRPRASAWVGHEQG